MHSRSAKSKITGKFTVVVTDWNGAECFRGEFDNLNDADRAGEREERAMTLRMQMPTELLPSEDILSDDDLLRELSA